MVKPRVLVILTLGFLSACDSDAPDSPGDAGPEPVAITERPSRGTYGCRVVRDRTSHSPRQWGWTNAPLVTTTGGTAYLARRESTSSDPITQPLASQFLVSSMNAAGDFGAPVTISAMATELGHVAAAPRADGFALVWVEGVKLRFAAFDGAGQPAGAARDVVDVVSENDSVIPRIAAGPDGGFGVVFERRLPGGASVVEFLVLAADGSVRMPPRRLDGPAAGMAFATAAPAITGGPAGYTMVWADPAAPAGAIDFSRADATGAETVARKRIAGPASGNETGRVGWLAFAPAVTGLLEIDGAFLVSWVESRKGAPDTQTGGGKGAWAIVRLARVDGTGALLSSPAALRAPTDSVDEVEPSLVRFGDAVALSWARGSHIYLCGGCVPDHRIDLLLIDPIDLTPLSEVVSINNGGGTKAGGLLRRQLAVLGKSLLMTYRLTFHVHNTPGSATFECDRVK